MGRPKRLPSRASLTCRVRSGLGDRIGRVAWGGCQRCPFMWLLSWVMKSKHPPKSRASGFQILKKLDIGTLNKSQTSVPERLPNLPKPVFQATRYTNITLPDLPQCSPPGLFSHELHRRRPSEFEFATSSRRRFSSSERTVSLW